MKTTLTAERNIKTVKHSMKRESQNKKNEAASLIICNLLYNNLSILARFLSKKRNKKRIFSKKIPIYKIFISKIHFETVSF